MKVELVGQFWQGDHAVDEDEAAVILLRGILVNGRRIHYTKAVMEWEHSPGMPGDFLTLWLEGVPGDDSVRFGGDQVLYDTDHELLGLPVSHISFVEYVAYE